MAKLFIIADDLTGALDIGVLFGKEGLCAVFVTSESFQKESGILGDQITPVIHTETRHIASDEAYSAIESLGFMIHEHWPDSVIYKKIDSTLRGNISAEIAALRSVWPDRKILLSPSLPSQGRIMIDGHMLVNGIPLHQTAIAEDPLNPIVTSYIPDIIDQDGRLKIVTSQTDKAEYYITQSSADILVIDASSEHDLEHIATLARKYSSRVIPVGSAGLARYLVPHDVIHSCREHESSGPGGPMLFINGSLNPVSLRQTSYAVANGFHEVFLSGRDAALLIQCKNDKFDPEIEDKIKLASWYLNRGEHVCIRTVTDRCEVRCWTEQYTLHAAESNLAHTMLPAAAGLMVKAVLKYAYPARLIVFGGDTVLGLMHVLGIPVLYPVRELSPGIVLSSLAVFGRTVELITKAGGFGSPGIDYLPFLGEH